MENSMKNNMYVYVNMYINICIYILNNFAVCQKLPQHCTSTILII